MMTDGAAQQKLGHGTEVLCTVARSQTADTIPKVEATGAVYRCASYVDCSTVDRVLRPEFVARPEVATPPVFAVAEVVVLTKCDAH